MPPIALIKWFILYALVRIVLLLCALYLPRSRDYCDIIELFLPKENVRSNAKYTYIVDRIHSCQHNKRTHAMTTRKLSTKAITASASTYIGKVGEIFYDTATATLKISNGTTPGGATLNTDGSGGGTWPVTNTAGASGPTLIAIGRYAGLTSQGDNSVAIGYNAGATSQGASAVTIGYNAGSTSQGQSAVAVGYTAGLTTQGVSAVAVGKQAGQITQGNYSVAVGQQAGTNTQGAGAVAVGYLAGASSQGTNSVAIGLNTGSTEQGTYSVAIGVGAGYNGQGNNSVAIGLDTGLTSQGTNSVAIGKQAGETSQAANSIILNATGAALNQTTASTFTVKPVRDAGAASGMTAAGFRPCYYNPTTGEFVYASS